MAVFKIHDSLILPEFGIIQKEFFLFYVTLKFDRINLIEYIINLIEYIDKWKNSVII